MAINAYYEDELAYLRDVGSEFAQANPKLAGFLGREATDPDVERLFEGFAFLTARLRQRLDDELPELSHALIRLIWPHYLRPIPPLTILRFEATSMSPGTIVRIPAGARVRSRLIDNTSCSFATAYDLDVLPFSLGEVEVESRATSARLVFRLRAIGKANLSALSGGRMRLFFNTERDPQVGRVLLMWLLRQLRQIDCTSEGGAKLTLGAQAVQAGGLSDGEALLPWPMNTFSGFRLLQEYLTYPAKFLFVDIVGLAPLAAQDSKSATFVLEFDRPFPSQFRLAEGQLRLNCVPAVNLFAHDADPIRVDQTKTEYRVMPLGRGATSIHSIEEVAGYRQGRSERRNYGRFESFRHDLPGDRGEHFYFRERLRPSITGRGADTYVSFVDRLAEATNLEAEVVSIKLQCTNGPLADRLAVGSIDQPTTDIPAAVTVSNPTSVTPEIAAPIGDNLMWRLVANLARNYASFSDVDSLRSVLEAYDFQAVRDVQARRRLALLLESLDAFTTETRDTVLRGIPARLRRLTLTVDEAKLGGEAEMFLFGQVLNGFFASYVSINSLHQFAVRGLGSKAVFEWPPRFGTGGAN